APAAQPGTRHNLRHGHTRPEDRGHRRPATAVGEGPAPRTGAGGARGEGVVMWKFAPYVLKSLWRQRTRTLLTVSGAAVALFVFCFVGAVQEGMDRLTRDE